MTTKAKSKKKEAKPKISKAAERGVVLRQIEIPDTLYVDIKEENLHDERGGKKQNSEATIIDLIRDGVAYRRLNREQK